MTGKTNLKYQPLGESTLLVEWPKQISEDILHQISSLQAAIESLQIPGVVETFCTYQSLAVYFDRECISYDEVRKKIENIHLESHTLKKVRWYIPTCYDLKYAPDLADLANAKGIRAEEVISLHTDTIYRLHFIGFLPGFMYLGGLPEKLHMPRKSNPARSIPSLSLIHI